MTAKKAPTQSNVKTKYSADYYKSLPISELPKSERNTKIESIGIYLPSKEVLTSEILNGCKESIHYPLERLTGIKSRRMAGDNEFAIHLAHHAIKECLDHSNYAAEDIDLLICCNISRYDGPNFQFSFEPSTSIRLREKFNMPEVLCFDISNACAGMFTGINVADAFLRSGIVDNVLVVSGEYLTHSTKTAQQEITDIYDDRMACLTLGDCGAALVLDQTDDPDIGFHEIDLYTLGKHSDCCIAKPTDSTAGGAIMYTDSVRIHDVAIDRTVKDIANTLKKYNWNKSDFQYFISHQTTRAAIIDFTKQFNEYYNEQLFDADNVIINLEKRGNTASTTHALAIWDNIHNGRINNNDKVIFSIQASGITLGSAPYTFDDLPERMLNYKNTGIKTVRLPKSSKHNDVNKKIKKLVHIESLGTILDENDQRNIKTAIGLAKTAAENCLLCSKYNKTDIDLLIHAGVHREEFISEPALAALIAGELDINSDPSGIDNKTFAFDVINGAMSFLNACYTATMMINTGKFKSAMILASEIENNDVEDGRSMLGVEETGSAVILEQSDDSEGAGFLLFYFKYYTDHVDKFYSKVGQENGKSYLDIRKNPHLNDCYVECIVEAVDSFLLDEGLGKNDIDIIIPPQISLEFIEQLKKNLDFDNNKIISIAPVHDYYTSSTLYSIRHVLDSGQVDKGDVALIINVGTGIQVGCALYRF